MLIISIGSTAFFFDFDIFSSRPICTGLPQNLHVLSAVTSSGNSHSCSGQRYDSLTIMPCVSKRVTGSSNCTNPKSRITRFQ